jgi:hypothetical protein
MRLGRPVVHGIDWRPADEVPGGELPPAVVERQVETLRNIDDAQGRARVRAGSYYFG